MHYRIMKRYQNSTNAPVILSDRLDYDYCAGLLKIENARADIRDDVWMEEDTDEIFLQPSDPLESLLSRFKNGGLKKDDWFEMRALATAQGYNDSYLCSHSSLIRL